MKNNSIIDLFVKIIYGDCYCRLPAGGLPKAWMLEKPMHNPGL